MVSARDLKTESTSRVGLGLARALLTPDTRSLHLFAFGISTGAAVWHTLISAPASYKNLPRQSFGNLQAVLLPSVFGVQAAAAGGLLVSFLREYPIVYHRFDLLDVHCWQAVTLLTTTGLSLFNLLVATPTCSKLMSDRHRQERAEGKDYSDPSASEKMKKLNVEFASAHSLSATLQLFAIGGLVEYGLWLAKYGLGEMSLKRVTRS